MRPILGMAKLITLEVVVGVIIPMALSFGYLAWKTSAIAEEQESFRKDQQVYIEHVQQIRADLAEIKGELKRIKGETYSD